MKSNGVRLPLGATDESLESGGEFVRELVMRSLRTMYHPVGTCSMMKREEGGVVDARCAVYGVKKLRVVDASIMPTLPRGQLMSVVYAMAEKMADVLKETHGEL